MNKPFCSICKKPGNTDPCAQVLLRRAPPNVGLFWHICDPPCFANAKSPAQGKPTMPIQACGCTARTFKRGRAPHRRKWLGPGSRAHGGRQSLVYFGHDYRRQRYRGAPPVSTDLRRSQPPRRVVSTRGSATVTIHDQGVDTRQRL